MTTPPNEPAFACIEAGGTKFVVGIVSASGHTLASERIATTQPETTLPLVIDWLIAQQPRFGPFAAAGIASFGPIERNRAADNWGYITRTTKPGWTNTDFAQRVGGALGVAVGFDTDVNGAALAETRWGAAQGQNVSVYLTIGTGIGGGAIVNGVPIGGLSHPEMGHIRTPRHPADRDFGGICPFHGCCIEGLASGPAIKARWGETLSHLPDDHPAHDIVAWYVAQLVVTLQSIMEPGRIVIGGGVMGAAGLLDRVRNQAAVLGGGYFSGNPHDVIVAPGLGDRSGLLGALALAQDVAPV